MSFSTIITEGGLLPADLLDQIADGELEGQTPRDFDSTSTQSVNDMAADIWQVLRSQWQLFQQRMAKTPEGEKLTSETRQRWVLPLLQNLGYEPVYNQNAYLVGNHKYAISHRADLYSDAPPIHIAGAHTKLDTRAESGGPRLSPHGLMQEYLNSTEQLWGIVTNGLRLRLLRDSSRFARPSFVEFDLQAMFEEEKFSEFLLFFRLLHRSRLPKQGQASHECLLERYHQRAIESGGRVREGLRDGVEEALLSLGNGLLSHPSNHELREKLQRGLSSGKDGHNSLTPLGFYRQLLRLVYRMLFLMVAEERGLIAAIAPGQDEELKSTSAWSRLLGPQQSEQPLAIYLQHYSLSRLRRLAEESALQTSKHDDLWRGLQVTFQLFEGSSSAEPAQLGLAPLDGDLFGGDAIRDLSQQQISNADLIKALRSLSLYTEQESNSQRRVNYSALDVEELGSVYESLLDLRPVVAADASSFAFASGTERKTTGSYYTRPELVQELIKSALEPVLLERIAPRELSKAEREQAILSIKVCDPTCGSGHFLLAAARRLGRELARVRSGEEQPAPSVFREAVRDVIQHCIFGVDLNPLAVDLCKLALWLEGHSSGKPLSFLDHHIRHGNGLIGTTFDLVKQGIPDDAYKPVSGDDKSVSSALRKRNKTERELYQANKRQHSLFDQEPQAQEGSDYAQALQTLDNQASDDVTAVRSKASDYYRQRGKAEQLFQKFNLWCAAFFMPHSKENLERIPTTKTIADYEDNPRAVRADLLGAANALAHSANFFHWELEFPQIFLNPERPAGFDVVLGNPPWERIKLQEQEHFVDVPEIRNAGNKAARDRVIAEWRNGTPQQRIRIAEFDQAKHRAESESRFVRASGRFPLTAVGDVNTYALFAEHARTIINDTGRAGIIVPTGIATDDNTKAFFASLSSKKQLISLFDFENSQPIFPGVHRSYKFCTLTIGKAKEATKFIFFATNINHLADPQRRFTLSPEEIALINPNTRTAPTFRTQADAELTKKIYRKVPVLITENQSDQLLASKTSSNPWNIRFMSMFHMANDSGLFLNQPTATSLPLYEAKLIHQYTHRWASYENGDTRDLSLDELQDPRFTITPRYWVEPEHVENKLIERNWQKLWLLGWRDITNATNERSIIASLIPIAAVGDTFLLMFPDQQTVAKTPCLLATLNSLTFDFVARQKIAGVHAKFFTMKQLPALPPQTFGKAELLYIVPRVLELVYTAYDLQPFAQDIWDECKHDLDLREKIMLQRRANHSATHQLADPQLSAAVDSLSLFQDQAPPPFIWHEERRAQLRAELDAYIAKLYGLSRDELRYILDPKDVYGPDFPGETFRVLKEKEERLYKEYRTRRLVLEAWDALE
jgi:Type I restriction-modification system methyltransferase subunit